MADARESYVLVVDDNKLVGILTERDVVKNTASKEFFPSLMLAEAMTQKLITVKNDEIQDIFSLSKIFVKHRIRHLPVLDDHGCPIGIVTSRSLRQLLKPEYLLRYVRASEVMSRQVICGRPDETVMTLVQRMATRRISCIVIVNKRHNPIGIVTERDVVRFCQAGIDLV